MANHVLLEILSPRTGRVLAQSLVNGLIQPPGPVQVLVHYPDGKWHLQFETCVSWRDGHQGAHWSATCRFGGDNVTGGSYDIVAVAGNSIRELILDCIPDSLPRSQVVHVRRGPHIAAIKILRYE